MKVIAEEIGMLTRKIEAADSTAAELCIADDADDGDDDDDDDDDLGVCGVCGCGRIGDATRAFFAFSTRTAHRARAAAMATASSMFCSDALRGIGMDSRLPIAEACMNDG